MKLAIDPLALFCQENCRLCAQKARETKLIDFRLSPLLQKRTWQNRKSESRDYTSQFNKMITICPACNAQLARWREIKIDLAKENDMLLLGTALRYEGETRKLIRRLKYDNDRLIAKDLAILVLEPLWHLLVGATGIGTPILIPVPLHSRKRKERGYNQTELLASEISRITGLAIESGYLRRSKMTAPQFGLSRKQRWQNVEGAFSVARNKSKRLEGKGVILVDDVYTTGATLLSCARAIEDENIRVWGAVAVARASNLKVD